MAKGNKTIENKKQKNINMPLPLKIGEETETIVYRGTPHLCRYKAYN